jgi:hypothetical protein
MVSGASLCAAMKDWKPARVAGPGSMALALARRAVTKCEKSVDDELGEGAWVRTDAREKSAKIKVSEGG